MKNTALQDHILNYLVERHINTTVFLTNGFQLYLFQKERPYSLRRAQNNFEYFMVRIGVY